jgi:hypothetical protein
MVTALGTGYAMVRVSEDNNPNHGGGPIRKASGVAFPARAWDVVRRTPHAVVYENEPGAAWTPPLATTKMFLPDGRLVNQSAEASTMMGGAFGAAAPWPLSLTGTLLGLAIGVTYGVVLAQRGRRGIGLAKGAFLGAGTGFLLSGLSVLARSTTPTTSV